MYVNFDTLKFKNINSYGNKVTNFEFKNGLNLIAGSNGQGKSTIIDAICFCLFGVPFRRVKINELINRTNKKGLWTNITFSIENDKYEITRSLKPDKLEICKNGNKLELLSSKKLTQEEVDRILGLDITLFRQIISLSINYSKPFLSLTQNEKRDIIESIFNIKVFGSMFKTLKNENSGTKIEWEINNRTITILEENIKSSRKQITNLEKTRDNFDKDKNSYIEKLNKDISKLESTIKHSEHVIEKLTKKNSDLVSKKCKYTSKDKEILNREIGSLQGLIDKAQRDILFFNTNTNCNVCNSEMTTEHRLKHITSLQKEIDENQLKITNSKNKKDSIEKQLEDFKKRENEILENNTNIHSEESKIKFHKEQIEDYKNTLEEVKIRTIDFDIDEIKKEFETKKEEYKDLYSTNIDLQKAININQTIFNILGDEGIKSHFFTRLIPILNKKVNGYLSSFEIPLTIVFNEFMEEKISTFGKYTNVPYPSFSEGEKKRIDISILLSFIETTKIISNWSSNIIFFDELLDTSTDDEGMSRIVDAIKNFIIKDKELCVFIMTHRSNDYYFDHIYNITKNDGFSSIN
jgi:DNA repair exonuclease SbcCD ATPase subunit